ncbi:tetratricopeptide repeat protein [Bacteroides thetaiotaomicron]|uniref:tetratricopeptide repeat protein n=1 Tax=Bacteroides thetaiotaomicron TaxID=818 RepID=UPI0039C2AB92
MAGTQTYYLFKRMGLRFSVFIGLFLLFLSSCTSRKENQLLLHADSLMIDFPDSALIFLESIPFPQKLSRGDRALYALLLTQARHKNYVTLSDDSLIKVAVNYYGKKKSLRAAQAHYYWGATYRDMGRIPFAVDKYLDAIQLMPDENEFLAMIYDNLAECYEDEDLYDVAIESYRKSCHILYKDKKSISYSLRGIAHVFLLQHQLDSALCYFQKAYDCVLATQDSSMLPLLYNDFSTVYLEKKEYARADEYASKAISMMSSDNLSGTYHLKGMIMLGLNRLDSARYFFNEHKDEQDIYGKAVRYNGLREVEKRQGNWEAAVQNADVYMAIYDSIQKLSDRQKLDELMDNHQLEEHKRMVSRQEQAVIGYLVGTVFILVLAGVFFFMWNDRRRKKRYIALQKELMQKRVDTMELREEKAMESEEEHISKLVELGERQFKLCMSMFEVTECYKKLQAMETATPKQLLSMSASRFEINVAIRKAFIDVMANLEKCCPALTNDDLFYCVLSLMHCSNIVILELMNVSSEALKMRKSRIKGKLREDIFEYIFC